ncbi:hypothetical protein [Paraglaciecola sp. L3A3]|uniref:hypothetical protein n=1 Tax=Paraglaciecola sp. L3A3 TaxID=2686358 RepID=UPI00131DD6DE|nr:hypothetical protein [Paraglaciecola sp. L3A3]
MRIFLIMLLLSSPFAYAEKGLITASGFGTVDLSVFKIKAQAKMMAKRAATVDAQRNLAEQLKGVRLTGGTTMEEYEISSDIVATRVKSLLNGAFEKNHTVTADEQSISVEVVMAICVTKEAEPCLQRSTVAELESFIQQQKTANK